MKFPVPWLLFGLFMILGCNLTPPIGSHSATAGGTQLIGLHCSSAADCQAALSCAGRSDTTYSCLYGDCWVSNWNQSVFADMGYHCPGYVPTPPSSSSDAGVYSWPDAYTAPSTGGSWCSVGLHTPASTFNQGAGQRMCHVDSSPGGRGFSTGWVNVICDNGPCTVEILSMRLYFSDGYTATEIPTSIGWAAEYRNFFSADDWHQPVSPLHGSVYSVPRLADDRILHLGLTTVPAPSDRSTFVVVEFRTTGDAQLQPGTDRRVSLSDTSPLQESVGDWASCNTGASIRVASPLPGMSCADTLTLGSGAGSSSPPPPTGTGHAIRVSVPSSVTGMCSGTLRTTLWGGDGITHSVNGVGSIEYNDPGSGFLWFNLYCNDMPWGSRWGTAGTHFGTWGIQTSVDGVDHTTSTTVCSNTGNLMALFWLDSRSGCP